jgi:lipoate-protein ligase A
MQLLDLTLESPAANIALDEALLEEAEAAAEPCETLRLWEPRTPFVVIGRGSKPEVEVRLNVCRDHCIPVLRRASGGAAIVTGPGCLMYALVLSLESTPALRSLDETHRMVLETMAAALNQLAPGVGRQGTSDLAMANSSLDSLRKFSGNSVRVKRRYVLYHGTLLYNFSLDLITDYLLRPPRQPTYRAGRDHRAFITNFPVDVDVLRTAVVRAWRAETPRTDWPQSRVNQLLTSKYEHPEWTIEV